MIKFRGIDVKGFPNILVRFKEVIKLIRKFIRVEQIIFTLSYTKGER